MYCEECGFEPMAISIESGNTRLYICSECFYQQSEFIEDTVCKHEYDSRNKGKCIHCGK